MNREWIEYQCDGKKFQGYFAYNDDTSTPRPAVIVAHAWRGQDDFARQKAEFLTEFGYVGFAADLYGDGINAKDNNEAAQMMMPLFEDRKSLRNRIVAAYQTVASHRLVDPNNIGAIGFCFGGLTVIELLRSGANVKGVVSFHGLLGDRLGDVKAHTVPLAAKIQGSLLILHGYHDPLVSQEDIMNAQKEFSHADVDWQMHIYGDAAHAFTNPIAKEPDQGLMYHPRSEQRALQSMQNFFSEIFE